MHQHIHQVTSEIHHDQHEDHTHHTNEDECILCLNLHIPYAIDDLPSINYSIFTFDIICSYHIISSIDYVDTIISLLTNKGPPSLSIIS